VIKVCGLSLYGDLAASTRYRLGQYVEPLRKDGIDLSIHPLLDNEYLERRFSGTRPAFYNIFLGYAKRLACLFRQTRFDLAIVHVELLPFMPGLIESALLSIPYIYDFDDAFFLKYRIGTLKPLSFLLANKFDPLIARAAFIFAGNKYLAEFARAFNPATTLLPTVVDTGRYICQARKQHDVFTVGWIGSPSTSTYLKGVALPLSRLSVDGPVRFVVVGGHCDPIEGVDVLNVPWDEASEITLLNSFDVGIMPLTDDDWARGKCAFKLIQYMACSVPVVASPVGANVDVVDSSCGFLASDEDAWVSSLRTLRGDRGLRLRMGASARLKIENNYSLRCTIRVMAEVIKIVAARK
jgi:glycosyltransferase involved in cell wall biosynthesis